MFAFSCFTGFLKELADVQIIRATVSGSIGEVEYFAMPMFWAAAISSGTMLVPSSEGVHTKDVMTCAMLTAHTPQQARKTSYRSDADAYISNKLLGTSASLLVTSALLVVTRTLLGTEVMQIHRSLISSLRSLLAKA